MILLLLLLLRVLLVRHCRGRFCDIDYVLLWVEGE